MQILTYNSQDVEVITLDNEVLFNAKQVGEILEIGASAVRNHLVTMNDKQKVKITNTMLENSNVRSNGFRKLHNTGETFLTEAGVYKLVFKSRKPEAEKFMDWIAEEVLPSIRKTGGYIQSNVEDDEETIMAKALMVAQATIERNKAKMLELQNKIEEQKHKVVLAETIIASEGSISIGDYAKQLNKKGLDIGRNRLFKWLRENGYIMKKGLSPTQKSVDLGVLEVVVTTHTLPNGNTQINHTSFVTSKGIEYFFNKIN